MLNHPDCFFCHKHKLPTIESTQLVRPWTTPSGKITYNSMYACTSTCQLRLFLSLKHISPVMIPTEIERSIGIKLHTPTMTGLEPAIPRSEVWFLIHQATWSSSYYRVAYCDYICVRCNTQWMQTKTAYPDKTYEIDELSLDQFSSKLGRCRLNRVFSSGL